MPVLLIRARNGQGGDTPFREIFADEALGWSKVTSKLAIADVDGGHFSMLQEPFAEMVAQAISEQLDCKPISKGVAAATLLKASAA
jgi:thioesterase domain-containing protein